MQVAALRCDLHPLFFAQRDQTPTQPLTGGVRR